MPGARFFYTLVRDFVDVSVALVGDDALRVIIQLFLTVLNVQVNVIH